MNENTHEVMIDADEAAYDAMIERMESRDITAITDSTKPADEFSLTCTQIEELHQLIFSDMWDGITRTFLYGYAMGLEAAKAGHGAEG